MTAIGYQALVELLEETGAAERSLRRPPPGRWFPIDKCDICAYLPKKKEMGKTMRPQLIPPLSKVHAHIWSPDRYVSVAEVLLQCPICGTCCMQEHSIDDEDAFACGGPHIVQRLERWTVAQARDWLQKVGAEAALVELT